VVTPSVVPGIPASADPLEAWGHITLRANSAQRPLPSAAVLDLSAALVWDPLWDLVALGNVT
jgi:hypothetical protein